MSELQLEGYNLSLHKQRIYCVGDINIVDKLFNSLYLTYEEEVIRKHKVVIIFSDIYCKYQPKWINSILCDAIFRIRDNLDLRLAATFIQHTVKPLIIIWYGSEIPPTILNMKDDITIITGGKNSNIRDEYSSIIWNNKTTYQEVYPILFQKFGSKTVDIRSVLQECSASSVFLAWSSIGDNDKKGSLYWYDITKKVVPAIDYKQASEYLRGLADVLEESI